MVSSSHFLRITALEIKLLKQNLSKLLFKLLSAEQTYFNLRVTNLEVILN